MWTYMDISQTNICHLNRVIFCDTLMLYGSVYLRGEHRFRGIFGCKTFTEKAETYFCATHFKGTSPESSVAVKRRQKLHEKIVKKNTFSPSPAKVRQSK